MLVLDHEQNVWRFDLFDIAACFCQGIFSAGTWCRVKVLQLFTSLLMEQINEVAQNAE